MLSIQEEKEEALQINGSYVAGTQHWYTLATGSHHWCTSLAHTDIVYSIYRLIQNNSTCNLNVSLIWL